MRRRYLLAGTAILLAGTARAAIIKGELPWRPNTGGPPAPVDPAGLQFLMPEEAAVLGVLADRIIPADSLSPGGRDMGCVVFIDRQLAGPFGRAEGLYMRPPFADPLPTQGQQSPLTPAARYRAGLAGLARHVRLAFAGRELSELPDADVDALLSGMESGVIQFPDTSARAFFDLVLTNMKEGFLSDPVYGGNRNMAGWAMLGFPGARYDYRDWITRHNQPYPLPPVGIRGRSGWKDGH